jgi:isocitrate dehydrogenase (NAD+)
VLTHRHRHVRHAAPSLTRQSVNVQLRKDLGLGVNLVHGFSLPNVPTRHADLDIVVIR